MSLEKSNLKETHRDQISVTKEIEQDEMAATEDATLEIQGLSDVPIADGDINLFESGRSLQIILPEIKKIPLSQVRIFPANPPTAVSIAVKIAAEFKKDCEKFVRLFTKEGFNPVEFENLMHRAKGYWQADLNLRLADESNAPLKALLESAKPLKSKLSKAANYLWSDDPILGEQVAKIRNGRSTVERADDFGEYTTLFSNNWPRAKGKCDVTEEDLKVANQLGMQIMQMSSATKNLNNVELRETRDRAGEYLRRGIDEIRAVAQFFYRKNPDELDRYPSLFGGKRKSSTSKPEPTSNTNIAEETTSSNNGEIKLENQTQDTNAVQPITPINQ